MMKYIRAEFFKIRNRKCTWGFLAFGLFSIIFMDVLLKLNASNSVPAQGNTSFSIAAGLMIEMGWFLILAIMNIENTNESRNCMLKNTISFGINRTKVYFYRFITSCLLMVVMTALYFVFLLVASYLFFPSHPVSPEIITKFVKTLLVCMSIWLGALGFGHMLSTLFNSGSVVSMFYCLFFLMWTTILDGLHMLLPKVDMIKTIEDFSLQRNMQNVMAAKDLNDTLISNCVQSGLVHMVIFVLIGYAFYRKKEIK